MIPVLGIFKGDLFNSLLAITVMVAVVTIFMTERKYQIYEWGYGLGRHSTSGTISEM